MPQLMRLTWVGLSVEVVADRGNHPELHHLGNDRLVGLGTTLTNVQENPPGLTPAQGVPLLQLRDDAGVTGEGKGREGAHEQK